MDTTATSSGNIDIPADIAATLVNRPPMPTPHP
jgi:hypothetical protein